MSAIVVYPMNALANSQYGELEKFIRRGFPGGRVPLRFATYIGTREIHDQKQADRGQSARYSFDKLCDARIDI